LASVLLDESLSRKTEELRAELDSYLSKMEKVDSSNLTVDGLKYLKNLEQLEDRKLRRGRPASSQLAIERKVIE
jgi:hypothetical protein